MYSSHSAFSEWSNHHHHHLLHEAVQGPSQWLLKCILFIHNKWWHNHNNSPKSHEPTRFQKGTAAQDELSANHVLSERRGREKLNERFIVLRSLVPFVTKMDKASILGDTIVYVKHLRKKIQDLEAHQIEMDQRSKLAMDPHKMTGVTVVDKRKYLRIAEGSGGAKPVARVGLEVQVSIIESDALVELQCPYREGLLLDVMQMLRGLLLVITTVRSSLTNGVFVAEFRAKVKKNAKGKKPSIMEVKRAIHKIVPPSNI